MYPRCFVSAAGDTICAILAELQIRDDITMCALVLLGLLPGLDVEERDFARIVPGDDNIRRRSKRANCRFTSNGIE
jgi:hypothetical protein